MSNKTNHQDIRLGTLVRGNIADPADYIHQILPYGFESFQLFFWQTLGGVDLPSLAAKVNAALADSGAIISSLGIFGNPLESGPTDMQTLRDWEACIDHAHLFGCDIVAGFTGRLRGKPLDASIPRFREVFGELARRAADKGVRLAFENCPMGGDWKSGDWNIAHNPAAWELMFDALPDANLGLEWEPCHQMTQLIEPMPQLREWMPRMFHLHGKCATIRWDVIRTEGIGGRTPWVFHRTPGFGDCNWTDILTELRLGGYRGCIDIEGWHDPVYRGELELTGQVHGLRYLKQCRGGDHIPNPA
ncbi:MAG: sugar phosphate isomerase/epimerase [Chloroflexi bacterium]|nr:sugar phosphate isomerase/epimerase [Chloroflexota bacterium]